MTHDIITLAHGNGGRLTHELIEHIFVPQFQMKREYANKDAAMISCEGQMMFTTDGYTVDPIFFPGGDIGKLAVCGTLNDLLVSGSIPQYLTVNFFIEEGFSLQALRRIVQSMGNVVSENHVAIVAGDTKVLPKGEMVGIQIVTTGIGRVENARLSMSAIQPGDKLFVTGTLGDHGAAVMLARDDYGLQGSVTSDCQSVRPLADPLMKCTAVRFMRDPTRGGLATVCHEISHETGLGIKLMENNIPVRDDVRTYCELLGFDPLYLASEGRIVFVASSNFAMDALLGFSGDAYLIGEVTGEHQHVVMQTGLGASKIVAELEQDVLPRIC
ncbi:MAG TPA: hydrogenase expression/formation protein HypE [Gammaproteobacteria bacterium]|nr:hydrogenase expression/formation protein HypE [Gammaproteobacteria bacterium]